MLVVVTGTVVADEGLAEAPDVGSLRLLVGVHLRGRRGVSVPPREAVLHPLLQVVRHLVPVARAREAALDVRHVFSCGCGDAHPLGVVSRSGWAAG